MGRLDRELYEEILTEAEHAACNSEQGEESATSCNESARFGPERMKAQQLIALVADPDDGRPMTRARVAELCGIDRVTLWRWINDEKTGGRAAWDDAVERYARGFLVRRVPLLLRVLQDEALHGKNKVSAGRLLLQYMGRLRDAQDSQVNSEPPGRVVLLLPDNGRQNFADRDPRVREQLLRAYREEEAQRGNGDRDEGP